jgi:hypothetical protein
MKRALGLLRFARSADHSLFVVSTAADARMAPWMLQPDKVDRPRRIRLRGGISEAATDEH